jgi:hypothetical protein
MQGRLEPGYHAMLVDLGITSFEDLLSRTKAVREYLPRLMTLANELIATNPKIRA